MLSRFAVTMLDDTSVQELLDHVVQEAVGLLEIDGAGVVLLATVTAPEYLAASDSTAMELEQLQSSLSEGPCFVAQDGSQAVSVPDLALDGEFPAFTAASRALGLAGVFAFPLRQGEVSLGALDLYRMSPGGLGDAEMHTAQVLADVLTAYVVNAQARAALVAVAERDRLALRQLLVRRDERDVFVATLVHELGTPLTSITGFAELLEAEPADLTDRQRRHVAAIRRNSERLRALTADLLTLSSLEPGAVDDAPTEVDLRLVVATLREAHDWAAETVAPAVRFLVPDEPVVVLGHRRHLERMLSNLVGNAVKYTPAGGDVSCVLSHGEGHATLEVCDTGIGIPEAEQREVFTRFFRASSARDRGIHGTGLGLAIVQSVVHGHGGTVAMASTPDSGTQVVVRVPLATPVGSQA